MQVYPNRFIQQLQSGLQPFYLVFGEEPQQKLDAINALRATAKQQGFDERQSLVADNQFSWQQLLEATQSMSLFSARQFIELELDTGKPGSEGSKILTALAEQPDPDTLLLIHGGKIGKDVQNAKWFKALDKHGVYVPCYPLEGNQLHKWVQQQAQQAQLFVDPESIKLLCEFCEGNLLAAKQEIEKLALLYPGQTLNAEQVANATVDQSRYNVFQLVDALLAGEAQNAVRMLQRLESEGLEPNIVLWALVREWQTLQQLASLRERRQPINWNQFRIWKSRQNLYQSALNRLSVTQLDHIQSQLGIMDKKMKSEAMSKPFVALCHLCLMFVPFDLAGLPLE